MKTWIALFALILISSSAQALEYGCRVHPSQLDAAGTRVVRTYAARDKAIPNAMPIRTKFSVSFSSQQDESDKKFAVEGFFRPLQDDSYSILPIPLITFELSRGRDVVYICGNRNGKPAEEHLTVYMMHGYHLDPDTGLLDRFGNLFRAPQLKVASASFSVLGTGQIGQLLNQIFGKIPLLNWFADLPNFALGKLNAALGKVIGTFAGIGVERVVFTPKYLEFSNGVDLNNPSRARTSIRINLDKLKKAQQQGLAVEDVSSPN